MWKVHPPILHGSKSFIHELPIPSGWKLSTGQGPSRNNSWPRFRHDWSKLHASVELSGVTGAWGALCLISENVWAGWTAADYVGCMSHKFKTRRCSILLFFYYFVIMVSWLWSRIRGVVANYLASQARDPRIDSHQHLKDSWHIWRHLRRDTVFSCNLRCRLIFLHDCSRTHRVASLRAGPVGRITCTLIVNMCVLSLVI